MKEENQFSFRIIAGDLRGRLITAPKLGDTRPPLSRVRKSIFDFLAPYLRGANYLDLFSGTGSYLFEAASRGAACAVGIEKEKELAKSINSQAARFKVADRLTCLCDDVFTALSGEMITLTVPENLDRKRQFDIIMIAPPQYVKLIDRTLETLTNSSLLTPESLILCQHDTSETADIDFSPCKIAQQRKYGNTTFTILRFT